ncbi:MULTISPECIES: DUF819 family protein [unclassified Photorhabdus]|uniref:DUF819 family protein n=1 Tax=unclassified Photorhabdus TaxID=2620880 RepID=UPI0031F33512
MLACNANIGGPTTAAALAISRGWIGLVGPIMVIGTVGYVIQLYWDDCLFCCYRDFVKLIIIFLG